MNELGTKENEIRYLNGKKQVRKKNTWRPCCLKDNCTNRTSNEFCNKHTEKKILLPTERKKNSQSLNWKEKIKNIFEKINIEPIDQYEIDGDFVESQAFGYLAVRSFLKLPISFPTTTGCKEPISGGVIVKNF